MVRQSSIISHRSSMARAYLLVEMLVLILTAPILMVLLDGFFRSFIHDLPQGTRLVQQDVTVLNMLDQLQMDMDQAIGLPGQADDATLRIERSEGFVCYRFEEGRIVRTQMNSQGEATADGDRVWRARDAAIEWRPWVQGGHVYAVEVHSYLNQRAAGRMNRKFVNSHVFFVGGLTAGGEIR